MKLRASQVKLNQYRQSKNINLSKAELNLQRALPAKLKSSDCCSHHWIAVVLGKRKEGTPVSWIAKSAAAGSDASSDTRVRALGGAAFSQTALKSPSPSPPPHLSLLELLISFAAARAN